MTSAATILVSLVIEDHESRSRSMGEGLPGASFVPLGLDFIRSILVPAPPTRSTL
jgi:hypothetical protein